MPVVTTIPDVLITPPPISQTVQLADSSNINLPGEIKLTRSNVLLRSFLTYQGFTSDLLDSYNNWIQHTLPQQVAARPIDNGNGTITRITRLIIPKPTTTNSANQTIELTPIMCRNNGTTYATEVCADIEVVRNNEVIGVVQMVRIGKIPVMLGSILCHLYGKSNQDRIEMGECPNDPLSYFIIKGNEKVVLMQEKLRLNRFLIFVDKADGEMVCRMTCNTLKGSMIVTLYKTPINEIRLRLAFLGKDEKDKPRTIPALAPYFILSNAYPDLDLPGSADEINTQILSFVDPRYRAKAAVTLLPSFLEVTKSDIVSEIIGTKVLDEAIRRRYPGTEVQRNSLKITPEDQVNMLLELLAEQLFPNMVNAPLADKLRQLSLMIALYLEFILGYRKPDDRNSWSNKRVETAGRSLEQLFVGVWSKVIATAEASIVKLRSINVDSIARSFDPLIMEQNLIGSFEPNSWGVKSSYIKENITDILKRESPLALYSHLTLINTPTSRRVKTPSIRMVQMSQLGYVDPVETSEGANCGLIKAKAITAKVTIDRDDSLVLEHIKDRISRTQTLGTSTILMVNGRLTGWCDGEGLRQYLVNLRRSGDIYPDTSIALVNRILYLHTDAARLVRPLLIVNPNGKLVIEEKDLWNASWSQLVKNQAVEYIDPLEQEGIMLAQSIDSLMERRREIDEARYRLTEATNNLNQLRQQGSGSTLLPDKVARTLEGELVFEDAADPSDVVTIDTALLVDEQLTALYEMTQRKMEEIKELAQTTLERLTQRRPFTHCELDPNAIFGIAASTIPLPDHNQAPRNVYQTAMGKQALGIYHSNYQLRFDTTAKTLAFPTRPLFETQINNLLGLNTQPIGQMVTVAIMTLGGYNQEDALIFNKASIDRGLFKMAVHRSYKASLESDHTKIESFTRPPIRTGDPDNKYAHLDDKGIAKIGSRIESNMVIIGKMRRNNKTGKVTYPSVYAGIGESGEVVSVLWARNAKGNTMVRVKLTDIRDPTYGDKFASRHAQKSTVGLILPEHDMPFTRNGMRPDIVINPHCFTGDTPVTLASGMSRRIDQMAYEGGDKVWSWDNGLTISRQIELADKEVQDIVELTLEDGRKLRCTPDHNIRVIDGEGTKYMMAKDLKTGEDRVVCGLEGTLDTNAGDEEGWTLDVGNYRLTTESRYERDRTLAFARILGYIYTDGTISVTDQVGLCMGHMIDAKAIVDDIELVTGARPAIVLSKGVYNIKLPNSWSRAICSMDGVTIGTRSGQEARWVKFLDTCPLSVLREFVAGLFGGNGHAPHLLKRRKGTPHRSLLGLAFSQTICKTYQDSMNRKMEQLVRMLDKLGVESRLSGPIAISNSSVEFRIQIPSTTRFSERVGFRYSIDKMCRLSVANSYWRYLEQQRVDYRFIPDAKDYLEQIDAVHWFSKTDYIAPRDEERLPCFSLKVIGRREVGKERVYDISVAGTASFLANGVNVSNCIPSRMTIAKLIEIVASKVASLSGERVNASAFANFDIEEFKRNLHQYGYERHGNEVMYSGETGRPLQAQIFIGPCYYQALRHHVKDKIQMRARGEVKLITHQPIGGRARQGGLRLGEMERDALISHGASEVLKERLCTSSDAYKAVFCKTCGNLAISNALSQTQTCRCCGNDAKFGTCTVPYAYRLLQNLLAGASLSLKFKLREAE